MGGTGGCSAHVAIGWNNFPPVRAKGGSDFNSKRRWIDVSKLLKERSENFIKMVAVHILDLIDAHIALAVLPFLIRLFLYK
jgi:hypothetical protein